MVKKKKSKGGLFYFAMKAFYDYFTTVKFMSGCFFLACHVVVNAIQL